MEEESKRIENKVQRNKEKFGAGKRNLGGAAFNILNLQYDQSQEGHLLAARD